MMRFVMTVIAPIVALFALQDGQQAEYINAGILPYSMESGEVRVLLGFDGENKHWNDFVGVCTPGETPAATAAREFVEETRGAFEVADVERRLQGASPVSVGPTRIFLMELPEIPTSQLTRLTKSRNSEKTEYCWVRLIDVLQSVDERGPGRAEVPAACGGENSKMFNLMSQSFQQGQEIRQRLLSPDPAQSATPLSATPRCGR